MFYPPDGLPPNRSIPAATVIPVLAYPDVREAVAWLSRVFGFAERLQISDHRAQITIGGEAMIVAEYIDRDRRPVAGVDHVSHVVMVRIANVMGHFEHTRSKGAEILQPPMDYPYGERQYMVRDLGGQRWTFSQTLTDANPTEWGGEDVILKIS
ncbi:MAG: VOC family protein [Fimbriimonas sp.]